MKQLSGVKEKPFPEWRKYFHLVTLIDKKIIQLLKEIFVSRDSLVTSTNQRDVEVLLPKLPSEYRVVENEKSENNFQKALQFLNVAEDKLEVVASLTDCLSYDAPAIRHMQNINMTLT